MILAAALLSAACTVNAEDPGDEPDAACDGELATGLSRWADAGFSGSIAIGGADGFSCLASFGMADEETPNTEATVFAIGSVSKAFTAAAVYDLADTGDLSLEDRAGALLPGLTGPAAEVTVAQLLLHTGGLSGSHGADHQPLSREDAIAAMSALESAAEPGTAYQYSNAGYALLALIVDEATGSYRDYLAEQILTVDGERIGGFWDGEPAAPGPRAVGYTDAGPSSEDGSFAGPHWALAGNGDLAMTAAELATWTRAFFAGEVISPEAVESLRANGFDLGVEGATEIAGWGSLDDTFFGAPVIMASGGGGDIGHEAVVAYLPDTGTAVTATTNTADVTAEVLMDAIGPALISGEPIPVPEGHAEVDPEELQAREGAYRLDSGGSFTVTAEDEGLAVALEGADAAAAMFASPDYTAEDVAAHEADVLSLLEGDSAAGQEERAAAEDAVGTIASIELAGSAVDELELRTYVRFDGADGTALAWYALDDQGEIAGVSMGTEPPVSTLVPTGAGEYRQEDLSGAGGGVSVVFTEDSMTVTGPGGTVEARRE